MKSISKKQQVRDRLVVIGGDHFRPVVEALDAEPKGAGPVSTLVDIVDGDPERLIDIKEVMRLTGIKSRGQVYEYIKTQGFPKPVKLVPGRRGAARWWHGEVISWMRTRPRG